MPATSELLRVDALVGRLCDAFPDQDEQAIRVVVMDAVRSLDGARLPQFVPVLAEKRARATCRARRQAAPTAGAAQADAVGESVTARER